MAGTNVPFLPSLSLLFAAYCLTGTNRVFRFGGPTLDLAGLTGKAILLAGLLLATRGTVLTPKLLGCDAAPLVPCSELGSANRRETGGLF